MEISCANWIHLIEQCVVMDRPLNYAGLYVVIPKVLQDQTQPQEDG